MFAPVGVLLMMVQPEPMGWLAALVSGLFSGLISVGWTYAFVRERWWVVVPLILGPFVLPGWLFTRLARYGFFEVGFEGVSPRARLIVGALMCVAFTAVGFTLSVMHMRRSERQGARALAELDLAGQVHATLVPPITISCGLAEVYGRSAASSTMGGDLIDAVVSPDRLDVLLGDVSGHGVGAGIVMAMLKGCIRTRLLRAADLGEAVADTNAVLTELTEPHMFATFVALRVRSDKAVEFALAGHLPIYHYKAETREWAQHPNECLPLGVDGSERFLAGSARVSSGDVLAVFTDGLMEVQNAAGEELGLEGVEALLKQSISPSLGSMYDGVMAGVAAHGPRLDDQSLVLVRIV